MGVVALVIGVMVFQLFAQNVPADVAIFLFGSKTTGAIVSQGPDTRMSVDHVNPTKLDFSFVASGSTLRGRSYAMVLPPQIAYTPKVDVEYLSFAPEYARVAGTTRNEGGDSIGWIMAAMVAFGGTSIGVPWWFMRRRRRAFERGIVARGTITFVGESGVAINGRRPKKLEWTFTDERSSRSFSGSLSAFMSSDLPAFTEGEAVSVLYDPDDPTANVVFIE